VRSLGCPYLLRVSRSATSRAWCHGTKGTGSWWVRAARCAMHAFLGELWPQAPLAGATSISQRGQYCPCRLRLGPNLFRIKQHACVERHVRTELAHTISQ
jgi:hypothetical protein